MIPHLLGLSMQMMTYIPSFSKINVPLLNYTQGFPGGSVVKNPLANAKDESLIPGLGGFPGEGNGNPLQYSCLENSMDRGAW